MDRRNFLHMSNLKPILLRSFFIVVGFFFLLFIFAMAFIKFAPQFGARPSGAHLEKISMSPNYKRHQFENLIETKIDYSVSNMGGMLSDMFSSKNTTPSRSLPTRFNEPGSSIPTDSTLLVTWFGHSAILLELEGKRIFLDPMLGPAASPIPFLFGKRFKNDPIADLKLIGRLDAVILSHDHYDHLDYATIKTIKDQVGHFYSPLGVGSHLKAWGVDSASITELDWWESVEMDHIRISATPARHFSGRGISDGNKTQWASWVIKGSHHTLYFSGDSGYGPHFKDIGEKHGPFDLTLLECGQYNERWEPIHMMPEQTAQAHLDLGGNVLMPIHWGAFSLAPHSWYEPAERLSIAAEEKKIQLITPVIGERFSLRDSLPASKWWQNLY